MIMRAGAGPRYPDIATPTAMTPGLPSGIRSRDGSAALQPAMRAWNKALNSLPTPSIVRPAKTRRSAESPTGWKRAGRIVLSESRFTGPQIDLNGVLILRIDRNPEAAPECPGIWGHD